MRPDLLAIRDLQGEGQWTIKDPISQSHFQLSDQQWYLLQCFDGSSDLHEIRHRFEDRFAPLRVSLEKLSRFNTQLYEEGLLIANSPGQGPLLLERSRRNAKRRRLGSLLSILAIRVPGYDAQWLLDSLAPLGRILFRPATVLLLTVLMLVACVLLIGRYDYLIAQMPSLGEFFHQENIFWLAMVFVGVKICHELGHGLACRRFGGECHEIGVMLLAFIPCLYCDVTDAWMIPNKWRRAVVSAAGIYIELWIATLCAFFWFFSEPGWVNSIFLNVVIVCSVSTLLINGNPLLRYDGYYILSDLWGVPNLHQRASQAAWKPLKQWLLRSNSSPATLAGSRRGLALYAMLAAVYRLFVVALILWALYKMLKSNHLQPLGDTLVSATLLGMIAVPSWRAWTFLKHPTAQRLIRWGRLVSLFVVVVAGTTALLYCPWPRTLEVVTVLQSQDARRVFAPLPGVLSPQVLPDQQIAAGDVIATLKNIGLQIEQEELEAELSELQRTVQELQLRSQREPELLSLLPTARAAMRRAKQQVDTAKERLSQLVIVTPCAGKVLSPPSPHVATSSEKKLGAWKGTPLLAENAGCYLEAGELLCLVQAHPGLDALLVVPQSDMQFVKIGQRVRLCLDQAGTTTWYGSVANIASEQIDGIPPALAGDRRVAVRTNGGEQELAEISYYIQVLLDEQPPGIRHGSCGSAKIEAGNVTLGALLWLKLQSTFRFHL